MARSRKALEELFEKTVEEMRLATAGLIPIVVIDLFAGCGGASQGLLRALELAGLTPENLARLGYYLRLININHWEISIETIRRNIAFAEVYNATIENWSPSDILNGVRPHLLIAAPECIMYSKARGAKKIKDQSRTTASWVLDWVRTQPHALYFENVYEWTTWGPLNEDNLPIKERMGEYFDAFIADVRADGYRNFSYGKFCCANFGDPTTRERFFGTAWHDEYGLPASTPLSTHTKYPEKYPWLEKWVAVRECLDLDRESQLITERPTIHAPSTIRRIRSGFVDQGAFDSPLYGEICDRMEAIATRAHDQLNARPSEGNLHRKLTPAEKKENNRILCAVREETRSAIAAAASTSLGHFEPEDVPDEVQLALGVIIGQDARNIPRTTENPVMTIAAKGAIGVAQPFLAKANASESSAFNDATQSIDQPKRTLVTKDCTAIAQPALMVIRHGKDDIRIQNQDDPAGTFTTKNELDIAQTVVKPELQPARAHEAEDTRDVLGQPIITKNYGERRNGETRATQINVPVDTIPGSAKHGLAQPLIIPQHFDQAAQSPDGPAPTIVAIARIGLAQSALVSNHYNNESRVLDIPAGSATTASGGGMALTQPIITPNFGERATQKPRSRTVREPAFAVTSHGAGMLATTEANADVKASAVMFFFTIGSTKIYVNIRYRMLHSSELAKAHSLGHVQFAGTETDAIRQIGNSIPARTAAAFIGHMLAPVFDRYAIPMKRAA